MTARRPRYADNLQLSWIRWMRDPRKRYRRAQALQDHYHDLANEAGEIKMQAARDVYRETSDYEMTAERIGRDAAWVRDAVRILHESDAREGLRR